MGLEGAEAILKLRAVTATGDFDAYWHYHLRQSTNTSTTPNTATATSLERNRLTSKEPHPSAYLMLPAYRRTGRLSPGRNLRN
jgi:hypothetical protein